MPKFRAVRQIIESNKLFEQKTHPDYGDIAVGDETSFAIQIIEPNVTLGGNGHSVTGNGSGTGIFIDSGTSGVRVENVASLLRLD